MEKQVTEYWEYYLRSFRVNGVIGFVYFTVDIRSNQKFIDTDVAEVLKVIDDMVRGVVYRFPGKIAKYRCWNNILMGLVGNGVVKRNGQYLHYDITPVSCNVHGRGMVGFELPWGSEVKYSEWMMDMLERRLEVEEIDVKDYSGDVTFLGWEDWRVEDKRDPDYVH